MGRAAARQEARAERRTFLADPDEPRQGYGVVWVVAGIAAFRMLLSTRGQLYWPDEFRYGQAFRALEQLAGGHMAGMLEHVFGAAARPGYVLMGMVPAAIQSILIKTGLCSWHSPYLYDVVGVFNVGVSIATLLLFHGITTSLVKSRSRAVLWTAVYGLMCNSNLYVRHLLPCDWALFWMMAALYLCVRSQKPATSRSGLCGLLGGVSLMIYAPYYPFMIILAALIVWTHGFKIRHLLAFGGGSAVILGMTEAAARSIGQSHIATTLAESARVVSLAQGSFAEGLIFGPRYLAAVEGPVGVVLMALAGVWVWSGRRRTDSAARAMLLAALGGYLLHGTMSVLHKSLFYGRTLHMFIPFVVLGAALAVDHFRSDKRQRMALCTVLVASIGSFLGYAPAYARLRYPHDVNQQYLAPVPDDSVVHLIDRSGVTVPDDAAVVTVNLKHVYEPDAWGSPLRMPRRYKLIETWPHPLSFPPYLYEGFSVPHRRRLIAAPPKMSIYIRRVSDMGHAITL